MWVAGTASTTMHVVIAIERFYATRPGNPCTENKREKTQAGCCIRLDFCHSHGGSSVVCNDL